MSDSQWISLFDSIPTWVMLVPIFICSVLAIAVIVERMVFYSRVSMDYHEFAENIRSRLKNGDAQAALELCARKQGPVTGILEKAVSMRESGTSDLAGIRVASERAIGKIERFLGLMSTVATVAPMFGLFGTVTGMMKSFSALTKAGQFAHDLLARGIAEALVTTALGLLVAIPSWIFYNYMVSRADMLIKDVQNTANAAADIQESA